MDQTCEELACLIKAASERDYPMGYKYIAFYFAGHGGIDEFGRPYILPMKKGKDITERFYLEENILSPFRPSPDKKKPKKRYTHLFFFDSCLEGTHASSQKTVSLVPSPEFVIAHATYPGQLAAGKEDGGVWTGCLCQNLKRPLSITTILDRTHDEVKTRLPQWPYHSSCAGELFLKGNSQRSYSLFLTIFSHAGKPSDPSEDQSKTELVEQHDESPGTEGECTLYKHYVVHIMDKA